MNLDSEGRCRLCGDEFSNNGDVATPNRCSHIFHLLCIKNWADIKRNIGAQVVCPIESCQEPFDSIGVKKSLTALKTLNVIPVDQDWNCSICFIPMSQVNEIGNPEVCNHHFCLSCLLEWSQTNTSCPLDRLEFEIIFVKNVVGGTVQRRIHTPQRDRRSELADAETEDTEDDFELAENVEQSIVDLSADDSLQNAERCSFCSQSVSTDRSTHCSGCNAAFHWRCIGFRESGLGPDSRWRCFPCRRGQLPRGHFRRHAFYGGNLGERTGPREIEIRTTTYARGGRGGRPTTNRHLVRRVALPNITGFSVNLFPAFSFPNYRSSDDETYQGNEDESRDSSALTSSSDATSIADESGESNSTDHEAEAQAAAAAAAAVASTRRGNGGRPTRSRSRAGQEPAAGAATAQRRSARLRGRGRSVTSRPSRPQDRRARNWTLLIDQSVLTDSASEDEETASTVPSNDGRQSRASRRRRVSVIVESESDGDERRVQEGDEEESEPVASSRPELPRILVENSDSSSDEETVAESEGEEGEEEEEEDEESSDSDSDTVCDDEEYRVTTYTSQRLARSPPRPRHSRSLRRRRSPSSGREDTVGRTSAAGRDRSPLRDANSLSEPSTSSGRRGSSRPARTASSRATGRRSSGRGRRGGRSASGRRKKKAGATSRSGAGRSRSRASRAQKHRVVKKARRRKKETDSNERLPTRRIGSRFANRTQSSETLPRLSILGEGRFPSGPYAEASSPETSAAEDNSQQDSRPRSPPAEQNPSTSSHNDTPTVVAEDNPTSPNTSSSFLSGLLESQSRLFLPTKYLRINTSDGSLFQVTREDHDADLLADIGGRKASTTFTSDQTNSVAVPQQQSSSTASSDERTTTSNAPSESNSTPVAAAAERHSLSVASDEQPGPSRLSDMQESPTLSGIAFPDLLNSGEEERPEKPPSPAERDEPELTYSPVVEGAPFASDIDSTPQTDISSCSFLTAYRSPSLISLSGRTAVSLESASGSGHGQEMTEPGSSSSPVTSGGQEVHRSSSGLRRSDFESRILFESAVADIVKPVVSRYYANKMLDKNEYKEQLKRIVKKVRESKYDFFKVSGITQLAKKCVGSYLHSRNKP